MDGVDHGNIWIMWLLGMLFFGAGFVVFIKYLIK